MAVKIEVNLRDIVGGGYRKFWESKHRYRVVKGGKASKKSTTAAFWYIVNIMRKEYEKANLLVVRAVYDTHRTSTFAILRRAIKELHVEDKWKATTSPLELRYLPTGQKIIFKGFDDWQKLASTTVENGYLCWVWLEEAFEIASEDAFEKLDLSVPRGEVPAPLFKQTTITLNPWSEKHWIKRRFFDKPDKNVFTLTTNYLCNEFLGQDDREIYEKMKEENPRKYAVAGLGEWGISEGLIYERWITEAFDKEYLKSPENPDSWKYRHVFGLDYGYTNDPTAFIAMAVNPIDKVIYIYDEFYQTHMLNNQIAAKIVEKGYQKERIRADSAEPKSNDDLRRLGISRIQPARKGKDSILNGISRLQEYKIIVHPDCVNAIMEFSSYVWAKTKDEDVKNRPEDNNNHLMDAMRYAMEDIVLFKPDAVKRLKSTYKERMKAVKHSGGGGVRPSDFKGGWG